MKSLPHGFHFLKSSCLSKDTTGECPASFSAAVVKRHDKGDFREKGLTSSHSSRWQTITVGKVTMSGTWYNWSYIHSQEQRERGCMGSPLLYSTGTTRICLGNTATHSGQGLLTLVNLLRKSPTDMSTDQPSGDNPSLRHSSQESPGCVELTNKANHHRS